MFPLFHRSIHSELKCDGTTGARTSDHVASRPDGWIAEAAELMLRTCATRAAAPDILAWVRKHGPRVLTIERLQVD